MHSTVCCEVVVPFQVIANGVLSGQPAATSILPMSAGPVSAPRITSVPGPAGARLSSAAWMIRTSARASVVSGMPA